MTDSGLSAEWVLALDDDPWAREIVAAMLEANGIPVHTSATVAEAMRAITDLGAPAVVLLDAMMPTADGFEVCRLFRRTPGLQTTRIVFVTSLDDDTSRLAALEAGADDLLTKPLNEAMLITRIRSLMELARYRERDQHRLQYETVLETIGEGVVTADVQGHVLTANRAAVKLLRLPEDILEQVHLPSFIDDQWTVETGGISPSSNARLVSRGIRSDGRRFALDWTSRRLPDTKDGEARWTAVVRDATDSWERDHALGRLLRTVGHKLRIPLTGITASIQLAADNPTLDDEGKDLLEIAGRSAERLQDTILRILDFTNASFGPTPSNNASELRGDTARAQLGIEDEVELETQLRRPVRVEVGLARRGVSEFISNARAAGAHQMKVVVRQDPGRTVTFAVIDDGPGFPSALAERIFEPFYQVDLSGESPGAGLGLSILAAELEAVGGSTGASAPPDGPTTVWLRLPDHSPLSQSTVLRGDDTDSHVNRAGKGIGRFTTSSLGDTAGTLLTGRAPQPFDPLDHPRVEAESR